VGTSIGRPSDGNQIASLPFLVYEFRRMLKVIVEPVLGICAGDRRFLPTRGVGLLSLIDLGSLCPIYFVCHFLISIVKSSLPILVL
jgi:hypothetical protein